MPISDEINKMTQTAPAPAPVASVAPAAAPQTGANKSKSDAQKLREEFVAAGTALRSQMTEEEKNALGSHSDDITFICCLGDPTKPTKRVEAGNKDLPSFTVIGWKFRANADLTIPVAPYKKDSNLPMAVEPATTRAVKAGEEFSLNLAETAMLLSEPQYCGSVTGDGKRVNMGVTVTPATKEPRPQLSSGEGQGSVKGNLICIADVKKSADGRIESVVAKPGYEAFQSYFDRRLNKKTPVRSKSGESKTGKRQQDIALAFRSYFKNKGE